MQDAVARHHCKTVLDKLGYPGFAARHSERKRHFVCFKTTKEKAQQFATIIDFVAGGIIAIDNQGLITVFNSASEKNYWLYQTGSPEQKITEIIPETRLLNILETERPEIRDIRRLDNETVIATNRVPVIVDDEVLGAVATYQDITEVQKLEQKIRIQLSEKGFVAQYNFSGIVHKSAEISECIKTAYRICLGLNRSRGIRCWPAS